MSTPLKLSIPKPCSADWETMSVEQKSRHCDLCSQSVYSLEDFEESEAVDLLQHKVCVRIKSNDRGEIKTRSGFSSILLLGGLLACGDTEEVETHLLGEPMPLTTEVEQPVEALQITAGKPVQANLEEPTQPLMGKIARPPEQFESQKLEAVETVTLGDVMVHEELGEAVIQKTPDKESTGNDCMSSKDGGGKDGEQPTP